MQLSIACKRKGTVVIFSGRQSRISPAKLSPLSSSGSGIAIGRSRISSAFAGTTIDAEVTTNNVVIIIVIAILDVVLLADFGVIVDNFSVFTFTKNNRVKLMLCV
jgi:hypothetical protein